MLRNFTAVPPMPTLSRIFGRQHWVVTASCHRFVDAVQQVGTSMCPNSSDERKQSGQERVRHGLSQEGKETKLQGTVEDGDARGADGLIAGWGGARMV